MINSKLKYLCRIEILETLKLCTKECAQARLIIYLQKGVYSSYIFDIYIKTGFGIK